MGLNGGYTTIVLVIEITLELQGEVEDFFGNFKKVKSPRKILACLPYFSNNYFRPRMVSELTHTSQKGRSQPHPEPKTKCDKRSPLGCSSIGMMHVNMIFTVFWSQIIIRSLSRFFLLSWHSLRQSIKSFRTMMGEPEWWD